MAKTAQLASVETDQAGSAASIGVGVGIESNDVKPSMARALPEAA